MNVSFKIKIFDSQGTRVLQVAKSTLTIGGASHCDVVIEHPSVSPEHARAWLEGGRIWVQDLGSSAGTALNDIRLPSLKPMLVRDLDVLRLGQSESTLGLEANVVRAPVVKAQAPSVAPSVRPPAIEKAPLRDVEVDQRRAQVEALSRELADLHLQLQMAKLEKGSSDELALQLQNLNNEIKDVQQQKAKWNETFREMELEKKQIRKNIENEINELKSKTQSDLRAQREKDVQKMEAWKLQATSELNKILRQVSMQRVRSWATRPLSPEMLADWEAELSHHFRRVLLNDNSPPPKALELPPLPPPVVVAPPTTPKVTPSLTIDMTEDTGAHGNSRSKASAVANAETMVHIAKPKAPAPKKSSSRSKARSRRQLALTSVVLALLFTGLWFGTAYFKQRGSRSLSSQALPQERAEARASQVRFEPKQSRKFRNSYTDNVLYLENYVAAEQNQDFRRRWAMELSKTATQDWKMDRNTTTPVLGKEQILIQDLSRIRDSITAEREQEGISQMRSREAAFLKDLEGTLKNRASVERFLKFKKAFYLRNQAYLSTSNP